MQIIRDSHRPGTHIYSLRESVDYLRAVGRGEAPAQLRLYRPAKNMAFGRLDELNPGFDAACAAAAAHSYEPLVRPVGGHAAGYHSDCLIVDHFQPVADAVTGTKERFKIFGRMFRDALQTLGVQAGLGQIPGEYCPGEYSVHAQLPGGDRVKIVGTAQRVVAGAWWFSAGIVVDQSSELREVTADVYRALSLDLDPETVGALTDINPIITVADVEDAVLEAYANLGFAESKTD